MKIRDLLAIESIDVHASAADKNEIIRKAIDLMEKSGKIAERAPYEEQVYNREKESTTGVGMGIAIPHGRSAAVKQPGLAAMVIPDGVDYDSLDGQPVNLLFLIAAPEGGNVHLQVLAQLSRMLMNEELSSALKKAQTPEEFLNLLNEAEEALDQPAAEKTATAEKEPAAGANPDAKQRFLILWRLRDARRELRIRIWLQSPLRKKLRKWDTGSRWKHADPAAQKIY